MISIMAVSLIFGCYIISSIILFKFPNILHKKKNLKFLCRHISHRGGAGENYENTITAFKRACEVGTDMLEIDCHITQDEEVIVAHDADLRIRTDCVGPISDYNYDEIPVMKKDLPVDFMPGVIFSGTAEDRRFPKLEEVFDLFPDVPINIDIKVNNDILINKVNELIKKYKREHITVWGNVKDTITQKCYRENPDICLLFSFRRTLTLVALMYTGLLPFIPLRESHLEIFIPSHLVRSSSTGLSAHDSFNLGHLMLYCYDGDDDEIPSVVKRIYHHSYGKRWYSNVLAKIADGLLIRKCLFRHLAKRGIQTYMWVMNTEEDFRLAFDKGATGVMTDYPTKLKAFLDANPQYTRNDDGLS